VALEERIFGPYRLVHQIATGGMAEIHLAKTRGLGGFEKLVALKMIHPNFSADDHFIQMLVDEAKITVQLQHVNIAHTFDLGKVGDTYYIAMEFVDGWDLFKVLRRASEKDIFMPVELAALVAKEVLGGLDYAHRKRDPDGNSLGIVHRDISPQNVLLSASGEVKVVDFGIAKATSRVKQTAVGVIKGKYYYMSPEQAWGDPLDHRTDVFSAGIILYEMLTGQMLYLEEDIHKLLEMVRRARIDPPSTKRNGIPRELDRIVMRALAKKPDMRWQTAQDFSTALERFLHAHGPGATSHRLATFLHEVMGDESPLAMVAKLASDPQTQQQARDDDAIVRSRGEFTDENSLIFRLDDLAQAHTAQVPRARAPSDATIPGEGVPEPTQVDAANATRPALRPATPPVRAAHEETRDVAVRDLPRPPPRAPSDATRPTQRPVEIPTEITSRSGFEEHTQVSGPPGFGGMIDSRTIDIDEAQLEPIAPDDPVLTGPEPTRENSVVTELPLATGDLSLIGNDSLLATPESGPAVLPDEEEPTRLDVGALAGRVRASHSQVSVLETNPHVPPNRPARPSRRTPVGVPIALPPADASSPGKEPMPWAPGPSQPWIGNAEIDDASGLKLRPSPGDRARRITIAALGVTLAAVVALLVALLTREPAAPTTIDVEVISIPPGARVTVDGESKGQTPLTLAGMKLGQNVKVKIELDRHQPWSRDVELRERRVVASLDPIVGTLVVTSVPPGADVHWNGGLTLGRTPLELTDRDPFLDGWVEVRKSGYKASRQTVSWAGRRRVEVAVELVKAR
jgi:serine/threonine protein kinase